MVCARLLRIYEYVRVLPMYYSFDLPDCLPRYVGSYLDLLEAGISAHHPPSVGATAVFYLFTLFLKIPDRKDARTVFVGGNLPLTKYILQIVSI